MKRKFQGVFLEGIKDVSLQEIEFADGFEAAKNEKKKSKIQPSLFILGAFSTIYNTKRFQIVQSKRKGHFSEYQSSFDFKVTKKFTASIQG